MINSIAVVAILKDEDCFIDEWLAYHRILGANRFVLYDDDPRQHLRSLLNRHREYVTVFDWTEPFDRGIGRERQTRAYEHSLHQTDCTWVGFLDIDEFIVLRQHCNLQEFLEDFDDVQAIVLNWHLFGHNGFYEDPTELITKSLIRRQNAPSKLMKSIVRRECVDFVKSAHLCRMMNRRLVVDANHTIFRKENYPGKTAIANINHYLCRSFKRWMSRPERGCLSDQHDSYPTGEAWRFENEACLRKFVEISARHNEVVDEYMLKYCDHISDYLRSLDNRA